MDDSFQNGLTALAGGGQAGATPIAVRGGGSATVTRFTTVASGGDSALLPPAVAGLRYTILNGTATSMNVFPTVGDTMNNTINGSLAVPAAKSATFFCAANGFWNSLVSA